MFLIYHGDVLIGRSRLEGGDPPMGVAHGRFGPTDAFFPLRNLMKPARDGTGKERANLRYLADLTAKTAEGVVLVCQGVAVCEAGDIENPFEELEVSCLGIAEPPYRELFPHHVKAYEDQFKT